MLGKELCERFSAEGTAFFGTGSGVDIADRDSLLDFAKKKAAETGKIDFVVNCAAYTAVDSAEDDEEGAARVNSQGAGNVALAARTLGCPLVHVSTDYVFDGNARAPYTEDSPISPLGAYGRTKAEGERAVARETDSFYILRTAWLYGIHGKNFVTTMLRLMNERESVKVVSDQRGSPTSCMTLARVIAEIARGKGVPFGVYHVTDLGDISWFDFAGEILRQGRKRGLVGGGCAVLPCATADYPTKARRPAYSVLDKSKIQSALNISLPDWKDSLGEFLDRLAEK